MTFRHNNGKYDILAIFESSQIAQFNNKLLALYYITAIELVLII